jgi:hypothetical protein
METSNFQVLISRVTLHVKQNFTFPIRALIGTWASDRRLRTPFIWNRY